MTDITAPEEVGMAELRDAVDAVVGDPPQTAAQEAGREHAERGVAEAQEYHINEALQALDPMANDDAKRGAFAFAIEETLKVPEGGELPDDIKDEMMTKWGASGTTKDEATMFIQNTNLSTEDKADMFGRIEHSELDSMTNEEHATLDDREPKVGDEEEAQQAQAQELVRQAVSQIEESNLSPDEKATYKERVNGLFTKLFGQGEKGKIFIKRSAKLFSGVFVVLIILILLEMKTIHNMAGSGSGGR